MTFSALPKLIEIEPTETCNLRCRMCHVSYMSVDSRPVFPAELVDKLDGLAGTEILIGSGFEPTMNKGFARIVRSLTRIGMRIELLTNGTLLEGDIVDALAEAHVRLMVVSFDGARKATYEYIRRRARYEDTLARIKATKSRMAASTLWALNCTVTRPNINEVAETVALWDGVGFDRVRFIAGVVRHPDMQAENIYPVRDRYHANLDAAAEELIASRRRISIASAYFESSPLKKKYPERFHGAVVNSGHPGERGVAELRSVYQLGAGPGMTWPCQSPWTFARIGSNGEVRLCIHFGIGNLRDRSFKDIWFGPEATEVRERVAREAAICPSCDHYRMCLRGGSIEVDKAESYVSRPRLDPFPPPQRIARTPRNLYRFVSGAQRVARTPRNLLRFFSGTLAG
jgi:radical SAM protein with 4Fe4S-binding SPASM domain